MAPGASQREASGLRRQWLRVFGVAHGRRERRLSELSRYYRWPVYVYLRRHAGSHRAALRLTAAFFRDLDQRMPLHALDRVNGRLREFLLGEVRRFLDRHDGQDGR